MQMFECDLSNTGQIQQEMNNNLIVVYLLCYLYYTVWTIIPNSLVPFRKAFKSNLTGCKQPVSVCLL